MISVLLYILGVSYTIIILSWLREASYEYEVDLKKNRILLTAILWPVVAMIFTICGMYSFVKTILTEI